MIEQWSNWVWGNGLLVLLLGTGGYLTIRTRFFPIRCVRSIFRSTHRMGKNLASRSKRSGQLEP